MGFGEGGAAYHDDHLTTSTEVSVTNATHLLQDLYKVGFRDPKHEIIDQTPPGSTFSRSLFVVSRKQCPRLGITVIIDGVEQPKIEAGGSRQYVDPVVRDVAPSPEGIRRRSEPRQLWRWRSTLMTRGRRGDRRLSRAARRGEAAEEAEEGVSEEKGPCTRVRRENLVGLDGSHCPSCVSARCGVIALRPRPDLDGGACLAPQCRS